MRFLTIKAPAKINLVLEIQGRRPDGYHEIRTIMHTVALSDTLTFSPRAGGLRVTCNRPEVSVGEGNLVYRAASMLAKEARLQPRVHIHIHKRIPLAAGLGGGSSDAAATLRGLSEIWNWHKAAKLSAVAKALGSDVPFFLKGGCALGLGRGDKIYTWPTVSGMPIALINPGFPLATAEVYKKTSLRLTRKKACINIMRRAILEKNVAKIGKNLLNHLETVSIKQHPVIAQIKDELLACGASAVLMSGSGPTVFGLLPGPTVAGRIIRRLRSRYAGVWITRTIGTINQDEPAKERR